MEGEEEMINGNSETEIMYCMTTEGSGLGGPPIRDNEPQEIKIRKEEDGKFEKWDDDIREKVKEGNLCSLVISQRLAQINEENNKSSGEFLRDKGYKDMTAYILSIKEYSKSYCFELMGIAKAGLIEEVKNGELSLHQAGKIAPLILGRHADLREEIIQIAKSAQARDLSDALKPYREEAHLPIHPANITLHCADDQQKIILEMLDILIKVKEPEQYDFGDNYADIVEHTLREILNSIPDKILEKVGVKNGLRSISSSSKSSKKEEIKEEKKKINFNFITNRFEGITEKDIEGWEDAYEEVDVRTELKKMREWLKANPDREKKKYGRFITNWLSGNSRRYTGKRVAEEEDDEPREGSRDILGRFTPKK